MGAFEWGRIAGPVVCLERAIVETTDNFLITFHMDYRRASITSISFRCRRLTGLMKVTWIAVKTISPHPSVYILIKKTGCFTHGNC